MLGNVEVTRETIRPTSDLNVMFEKCPSNKVRCSSRRPFQSIVKESRSRQTSLTGLGHQVTSVSSLQMGDGTAAPRVKLGNGFQYTSNFRSLYWILDMK